MMNKRNDGGPAFPVAENAEVAMDFPWTTGLSMRDWFAAKAMQALLHTSAEASFRRADQGVQDIAGKDTVCMAAYQYADAMLAQREK